MAGKKKITVELIQEATKDELLDIAGRIGIEDRVNYRMLKAELLETVLTEFLTQQEEAPSEDGEQDVVPQATAAEKYAAIRAARRSGAPLPEPEPEPVEEKARALSYHIVKGGRETIVRSWALYDVRRQLAIKPQELEMLQRLAMRDGEASALKVRRVKGRVSKITFIVRYS